MPSLLIERKEIGTLKERDKPTEAKKGQDKRSQFMANP